MLTAALFKQSPAPKPLPQTKWFISQCYEGIALLESQAEESNSFVLTSRSLTLGLNQELTQRLQLYDNYSRFYLNLATKGGPILDAWGEPLMVARFHDLPKIAPTFNPSFQELSNEVIIWSCGANKLNEFGKGDDVWYLDSPQERADRTERARRYLRAYQGLNTSQH